jgi:hypothetical protein
MPDDALAAYTCEECHSHAVRGIEELSTALDQAITDIGVMILALRACDEEGEPVPSRLRAHIRVMESEWFNVPTPEGARRRETFLGS